MRRLALLASTVVAAVATLGVASPAAAQESWKAVTYEESVPNRGLILSGVAVLGATYSISTIVALTSDEKADRALFVPVAGPWIDLAARPGCDTTEPCTRETTHKVLLVADGVGQAIGAMQIVGGLLFPGKRTVTKVGAVQIVPQFGLKTAGLTASGTF